MRRQSLAEDVDELGSHRDVEDTNISDGNALADEVEINLNMLGALMLDGGYAAPQAASEVSMPPARRWP
jgi:hypothetical protein